MAPIGFQQGQRGEKMSSHEAFWRRKFLVAGCALLGTHAVACSGGTGFTAQGSQPDGSVFDAAQNPDDSDAGIVVVVNPAGNDASAGDATRDAGTVAATDAGMDSPKGEDAGTDSPSCSSSELACGGLCVSIDTNNCGACGANCAAPDGGTASCTEVSHAYSCGIACDTNLTHCGNSCVDLQTDSNNCGRCGHGCVGAACVAGQCQSWVVTSTSASNANLPVVRGGVYGHADLVTDGNSIVWIDATQGVLQVSATGPSSAVVNLSPFQYSTSVSPANLAMAQGVVVWTLSDANNGVSIWAATEGSANSGAPIASLGASSAGDLPSGLALDANGANAYFLDSWNPSASAPHSPGLYKCNLGNKSCSLLYSVTVPRTLFLANDVAMSGARLFWTDSASGTVEHADYSANVMGSAVTGQSGPCLLTLDANYVYWANVSLPDADAGTSLSFSIDRTPEATPGTVTSVVPSVLGSLNGVASDGTNLYFIQVGSGQGLLEYAPVDGSSAPRSLKDAQRAYALAVGGGAIFWLNGDNTIDGIAAP
jgi:hypothetical protein